MSSGRPRSRTLPELYVVDATSERRSVAELQNLCYIRRVLPPVRRDTLAKRNQLDESDEAKQYARESPAERLDFALQSSGLTRQLALTVGNSLSSPDAADLAQKADQYAMPLRMLVR